jgi:carbamoyltransferase
VARTYRTTPAGDVSSSSSRPRTVERSAELIERGTILGWFDGASEVSPRALGHRSILVDPRSAEMKQALNARVKFREAFRPFAPSVLADRAHESFDLSDSPFVLRTSRVLKEGVPAVTRGWFLPYPDNEP